MALREAWKSTPNAVPRKQARRLHPCLSSRFQLSVLERILRLGRAGGTPGDLDKVRTRRLVIWKVCGRWGFCLGTELPDAAGAAGPGTALGGVGRRFPLEKQAFGVLRGGKGQ